MNNNWGSGDGGSGAVIMAIVLAVIVGFIVYFVMTGQNPASDDLNIDVNLPEGEAIAPAGDAE